MGHKPSNFFQMDRPESGGADRDDEREASGSLDRAKEEFAEAEARKRDLGRGRTRDPGSRAEASSGERPTSARGTKRTAKRRKK
jgi:hypothetical protein